MGLRLRQVCRAPLPPRELTAQLMVESGVIGRFYISLYFRTFGAASCTSLCFYSRTYSPDAWPHNKKTGGGTRQRGCWRRRRRRRRMGSTWWRRPSVGTMEQQSCLCRTSCTTCSWLRCKNAHTYTYVRVHRAYDYGAMHCARLSIVLNHCAVIIIAAQCTHTCLRLQHNLLCEKC